MTQANTPKNATSIEKPHMNLLNNGKAKSRGFFTHAYDIPVLELLFFFAIWKHIKTKTFWPTSSLPQKQARL